MGGGFSLVRHFIRRSVHIRTLCLVKLLWVGATIGNCQVTAFVNSGNPRYPFPQFLDYVNKDANLRTLASVNSPGVPHAEMEQRMRDAYQMVLNNMEFTGDVVAGVNYIRMDGSTCRCAEGYGYFLLAMAYMADKTNFDRFWMFVHDNSIIRAQRYIDGVINSPARLYSIGLSGAGSFGAGGTSALGAGANSDAAADGDVDIALALIMADMQWGPNAGITPPATGIPISYRNEALSYIKAMSDTLWTPTTNNPRRYTTGDVGLDGYFKNGPTWGENSNWATGGYAGRIPEYAGPQFLYFDYVAPGYFRQYRNWMRNLGLGSPWNFDQYKRCEGACDWQMSQLIGGGPTRIPFAGNVNMAGTVATFGNVMPAEDVRLPWRTILNYVWHGNADSTWNPTTHQMQSGGNTFERDAGLRYGTFLKNNQAAPWSNPCKSYGSSPVTYNGVPALSHGYNINGGAPTAFHLNWIFGSGAPAAVTSQDFDLMGQLFRECVIEWDQQGAGQLYLTSKPVYFHEWFKLLGMLVLSGNAHAPTNMVPRANLKVYKAVDKTFAYPGDLINYTITYRNYGSVGAANTTIVDPIPAGLQFVSASNGGVVSGGNVVWNLATVPGFVTGGLNATMGTVNLVLRVAPNATGRICNIATITCTNGLGWTSNEYPNNITDVMERNCVDIVSRPLYITKTADASQVNPGQTVNYTLNFGNQSVNWLNGGRPGVTLAFANNGTAPASQLGFKIRLYHGADEAYINYKNYRVSYFLQDANTNWTFSNTIYEGGLATNVTTSGQNLNAGSDANGAWNQRIIVQFADQKCTTAPHLYLYNGLLSRIHEGGTNPLRGVWNVHLPSYATINWSDDWSAEPAASAADGAGYFPITNDWTDPNAPNVPVTRLHKQACETAPYSVSKVLVEEWDGYTWRRAFGNGPVSGREIQNVVVRDVLPAGVTWNGFINATTLGVGATYNPGTRTITWTIPLLRINDVGQLRYSVIVNNTASFGGCPINQNIINTASISGTNESPAQASDTLNVTCNALPPTPPPPSALTKTILNPQSNYAINNTISYLLTYTNTVGSIATPDLNSSSNWTLQSGPTLFAFGSNRITTNANQNTVVTYGYAHGTNGTITGTINPTNNAVIGIAFRHGGGAMANGSYVTLKPNSGAGNVEVRFWNGTTQVGPTSTPSMAGGAFTFQLVLANGTASLWLNNFSGSPALVQTGITVQAGTVGFINGTPTNADAWASHQITAFTGRMDSGFNIQFYDPVPSNVTFVSASNAGSLNTGTVVWPMTNTTPATPLLAGTTLTRTWTGTVFTCPGGFISNTGYVRVFGFSPDQGSQVNATCGSTATPVSWLSFTGFASNGSHYLQWGVNQDQWVESYAIEGSSDGKTFEKIGHVPAKKGVGTHRYSYTVLQPGTHVFYRIVLINKHLPDSYSSQIKIQYTRPLEADLIHYPNPFSQGVSIEVKSSSGLAYIRLEVFDVFGKPIETYPEWQMNEAQTIGYTWPSGTYIVKAYYNSETIIRKVQKIN